MLRHRAAEGGVELSYDLPAGNCLVRADERLLRQILLNLLSNAVKFTPSGGRVTIALVHDTAGGLQVRISDTGIGIAPEDIDRVMQPFVQLENHLQRRYEGTGLGSVPGQGHGRTPWRFLQAPERSGLRDDGGRHPAARTRRRHSRRGLFRQTTRKEGAK